MSLRLALAIADTDALPSAFVVFRGFAESLPKAAALGYDGVELALKTADEVDREELRRLLEENNLAVSAISSGQVFAGLGLSMTDADPHRRARLRQIFVDLIELAAEFSGLVNIGRVRGSIGDAPRDEAVGRFVSMARDLADYAASKGVTMLLEPVNRYEIDFINSVTEGAELMRHVDRPNMKLMPDVFHMNIEDAGIGPTLARHIEHIGYVHLADSNRNAPGWGHTDFDDIFSHLSRADYDGWVSVEILPRPDPDAAAAQAARFLRPLVDRYNAGWPASNS